MEGTPRRKANECGFKEKYKMLKEQFIIDINDEDMTAKIIKELTVLRDTSKVSSMFLYGLRA